MERTTASRKTEPRTRRGLARRAIGAPVVVPVRVERELDELLHRQIYRELMELIVSGRVRTAARLPSSRILAEELGVGRNTVLLAIDQLISEGYVETRRGRGTFVCAELPECPPRNIVPRPKHVGRQPKLAKRAPSLVGSADRARVMSGLLRPGEPDCTG